LNDYNRRYWAWVRGLPLAIEFGKKYPTVGFDLSEQKIAQYLACNDPTGEVSAQEFKGIYKT
jgi:UDP-N-acetyl-D-galactosamine dehydrogenase